MTKFGSRGSDGPQFAGPHYVATNSHGNIVISDFHNHNIKIFTKEGAFIFSFGTNGEIVANEIAFIDRASRAWIWLLKKCTIRRRQWSVQRTNGGGCRQPGQYSCCGLGQLEDSGISATTLLLSILTMDVTSPKLFHKYRLLMISSWSKTLLDS